MPDPINQPILTFKVYFFFDKVAILVYCWHIEQVQRVSCKVKVAQVEQYKKVYPSILLQDSYSLVLTRDKLVNLERLKLKKCVRYFRAKIGWFMEYKRFLLVGTCLDSIYLPMPRQLHIWPLDGFPPFCRYYSSSSGQVGEYKCTVVGLGLFVCLLPKALNNESVKMSSERVQ